MPSADITRYGAKQDVQRAAICNALQNSIDASLPSASSKLWHGIPVWFVGENPAVGFQARKTGVMLMFWNGQHFDEPELEASGSFHMAQKAYNDASEIDTEKLTRWIVKAGESIWDMVGERNSFVAKRKATKARPKVKAPAKKAKAKAKAKAKSASTPKLRSKPAAKKATHPSKRRPAKAKAKSKTAKSKK
jgi:hypothetical protein